MKKIDYKTHEKIADKLYLYGIIWTIFSMVIGLFTKNICAVVINGCLFINFELRELGRKISKLEDLGIYILMKRDEEQ